MYLSTTSKEITRKEIKHAEMVRSIGGECMVLLEHDGRLPLAKGSSIALFGAGARRTIKGGTGSGDVYSRSVVSIEEGLKNAGFSITSTDWLDDYDSLYDEESKKYEEWVEKEAKDTGVDIFTVRAENPFRPPAGKDLVADTLNLQRADAAIYVLSRSCGEGGDRKDDEGDYLPTREEIRALSTLAEVYKDVILVLNIGAVMDLKKIKSIKGIGTILLLGQLGCAIGDAFADVVSGKSYPSGKLVDSWAVNYIDYPSSLTFSHINGDTDDEYYEDGIFVGYRYFDTFDVKPVYGFGYGLSYTSFEQKLISANVDGSTVGIKVSVKNTGNHLGKEVVQCYVSKPSGKLIHPRRELCAFYKTKELEPGMSDVAELSFDMRDLASFDVDSRAAILESGHYIFYIGGSLEASEGMVALILDGTVAVKPCPTVFECDCKLEEIAPKSMPKRKDPSTKLYLSADDIVPYEISDNTEKIKFETTALRDITVTDVIQGLFGAEELVSQLSVEEMAELCVGTARGTDTNVVGVMSELVPGAAGETSSICFPKRRLRPLVLADGPAGLRLTKSYEHEGQTHYQYCTAIPTGWSLAQSWNPDVACEMGDLVGVEMGIFHIDFWLAPALNIHRNPLCGRNFEYYSEDPLISGIMAAAVTRGVQRHSGVGATIKHFACNNLEDNRFFNNSHVSERALRDIYLKGFEIAVKTSNPRSIMSSYNLLNGTHTANSRKLLTGILRNEWDYKGFVMTDWFTSMELPAVTNAPKPKYPISSSVGCIAAGNDVQMPGCKKNVDDIIEAVTKGTEVDGYKITIDDLRLCTLHLVEAIISSVQAD